MSINIENIKVTVWTAVDGTDAYSYEQSGVAAKNTINYLHILVKSQIESGKVYSVRKYGNIMVEAI